MAKPFQKIERSPGIGFLQYTLRAVIFFFLIAVGNPAFATDQDLYAPANVPVVNIETDANGVDMTSGTFAVSSPFSLNVPAAGHLNLRTLFNGRRISFSLNFYLEDITYASIATAESPGGDPSERHIKVHLGGMDKLFVCPATNICNQIGKRDGAVLIRTAPDTYQLTDGDGRVVKFFKHARHYLHGLDGDCYNQTGDYECNAAIYHGYGYASEVLFPNGERLTYHPSETRISSNLGYELRILRSGSGPTGTLMPGLVWWPLRNDLVRGVDGTTNISLYKGASLVGSISSSATRGTGGRTRDVVETDRLGRTFRVYLASDPTYFCSWQNYQGAWVGTPDNTYLVPRQITSPAGRRVDIGYEVRGGPMEKETGSVVSLVSSVTRGNETWRYSFNSFGGTATDPLGNVQRSEVRTFGTGLDKPGTCGSDIFASAATKLVDPNNRESNYRYERSDLPTDITSFDFPMVNGHNYTRDVRGNITSVTERPVLNSGLSPRVISQAEFSVNCSVPVACNKPNWVIDARGSRTEFEYSAVHGGITKAILPPDATGVRGQKTFIYESRDTGAGPIHRLFETHHCIRTASCAGTSDEIIERYTYWENTFLPMSRSVMSGSGGEVITTSWAYDDAGRKLAETDPLGRTTSFFYDAAGRPIGSISPDPDGAGPLPRLAERTTYDADDLILSVEQGTATSATLAALNAMTVHSRTVRTYDFAARMLSEQVLGSDNVPVSLMQYSYDRAGRLECTAVRMNPAVYGSLPASACTLGPQGAQGPDRITRTVYDAAGQVLQVRKAVGTPIEIADVTYSYTTNGKIRNVIDANGNRAELRYDGFDLQTRWVFPSKTRPNAFNPATPASAMTSAGALNEADFEEYSYDANGNRLWLRKRDGRRIAFTYDALNRITVKDVCAPGGAACTGLAATHIRDVFYEYDLRGLQTKARFSSLTGVGIIYAYDGFGRLTSETQNTDNVSRTVSSQYNANGSRTRVTYPDGQFFTYDHDGLDRATVLREGTTQLGTATFNNRGLPTQMAWTALAASANRRSYGYDPAGRLNSIGFDLNGTAGDVTWGYTRNPASQILSESQSNDSYAWDGHVNLTRTYTTNGLNQYQSAGSAAFCYDANGNLTADGGSVYRYDVENRLVEKRAQGTGNTNCAALSYAGALQAELFYDPTGRLYQVSVGSTVSQRFAYDGNAMIGEYNAAGTMLRRYVHGSNAEADDPLIWYEGATQTSTLRRYLHSDPRGSIVAVTDHTGNRIAVNTYDEYGIPDTATGNDIATKGRFRYTGQAWIPELGMYYYKARIYSPTLGRFLQTDPIGYEDQFNLYAYVGNDPINGVDPFGLYECTTQADCNAAATAVNQIGEARDFYRSAAGNERLSEKTRVAAGKTADTLDGVLADVGTKNDNNGLTIAAADLPGRIGGDYDADTRTIRLDTGFAARSGEPLELGAVLAHEVQHDRQRNDGLGNLEGEVRPYLMQFIVGIAGPGAYKDYSSGSDYTRAHLNGVCGLPLHCAGPVSRAMASEGRRGF